MFQSKHQKHLDLKIDLMYSMLKNEMIFIDFTDADCKLLLNSNILV